MPTTIDRQSPIWLLRELVSSAIRGSSDHALAVPAEFSLPAALIAIDQGTTSTRAIAFDAALQPLASAQQELRQIYPGAGRVEHDPEEIWAATVATVRAAMAKAGLTAKDIAGIGITNQRETTVIWDRATGKPIHNAIVWQDRRTADFCETLRRGGHEPEIAAKTGLLLDPYFSASKIAWLLENVAGAREAADAGRLAFGTIDSFLLWRLTGGKVHATDATNAARTLLFDIGSGRWDDGLCRLFGVPASLLPQVRDCAGDFGITRARIVRRADPHSRHGRRPAGGDRRAGLLQARHDEIDLRHRLLRPAQHRRRARRLAQPAAHHHRLSARGQAHLCAGRRDLHRRRRGAMAARRAEDHRQGVGRRQRWPSAPIRPSRSIWCRPLSAWARPIGTRRRAARSSGSPAIPARRNSRSAALEAVGYQTRDLLEAMHADWPMASGAATVLRVDGGMTASAVTMQFLADILASPVDRPVVMETTALGAAYLAGRAAGLCPDLDGFAAQWRLDRRFEPRMDAAPRERKYSGWKDAVRRTLTAR